MGILIVLAVVLAAFSFWMYRSADKSEERFANRPSVITNPEKDLFSNQKYAIVKLLAFIQGASPLSAFNEEANRIAQSTIFSLGLSQKEVEKVLRISMQRNPEQEIDRIFHSLDEIRDRDYLANLYRKCKVIANISADEDTIEAVDNLFQELKVV